MNAVKYFFIGLFFVSILLLIVWGMSYFNLIHFKFFQPKMENARRAVFEETKSYVHGSVQDIGKYYAEYQAADESGKIAIKTVIQARFSEFDANNISNLRLKQFFIETRGY